MPDMNMMNNRPNPDDHEAAMARADLYKLANYSMKLFKMIHDGDQLEGWVQAKVTKAADYIASVYHFMEYEMKFSEYGEKLETSDMYSESVKREYKRKLTEAKVKLNKLKEKNIKDIDEGWEDMMKANAAKAKEKGTGKFDVKKTSTGTQYTRKSSTFDDGGKDTDTKKAEKKSKAVKEGVFGNDEAGLAKKSPQLQQLIALRGTPKYSNPESKKALELRIKKQMDRVSLDQGEVVGKDGKPVKVESLKGGQKKLDVDKDGKLEKSDFAKLRAGKNVKEAEEKCNHTAKGKNCPVHGTKECGVTEAKKEEKFDALKHVKNPTKGEKDAAKDVKRGSYADRAAMLKSAEKDGRLKEASKPDFLDMDKDGNKKEPMKKAVADKKAGPKKGVNPFAKK